MGISVLEIEFCTLYVVAERWILDCILRFMHAKNHFSDTLRDCHLGKSLPLLAKFQSRLTQISGSNTTQAPGPCLSVSGCLQKNSFGQRSKKKWVLSICSSLRARR